MEKKKLPIALTEEIRIPVEYVTAFSRSSRRAFRTTTNLEEGHKHVYFTIKIVKTPDCRLGVDEPLTQVQFHLRYIGIDFKYDVMAPVDIDIYVGIPNAIDGLAELFNALIPFLDKSDVEPEVTEPKKTEVSERG